MEKEKRIIDAEEFEELKDIKEKILPEMEKEILMWREKFFKEEILNRHKLLSEQVSFYFFKTSSQHVMKNGPHEAIKNIENIFINGIK